MIIISSVIAWSLRLWALRFFINDSREDWVNLIKKLTSDMQFFYRMVLPIEKKRYLLFTRYVEKVNEIAASLDDEYIKMLALKMRAAYNVIEVKGNQDAE